MERNQTGKSTSPQQSAVRTREVRWGSGPRWSRSKFHMNTNISMSPMEREHRPLRWCDMLLYLCVDDSGHPETLARPRHGQHGPEEDENGQDEREERRRHNVVQDDDKVAQHLRLGHHRVIEGKHQLQGSGQRHEELVRLRDFVVFKHAAKKTEEKNVPNDSFNRKLLLTFLPDRTLS